MRAAGAAWTAAAMTLALAGGTLGAGRGGAEGQPSDRAILHGGSDAGEAIAVSPAGVTVRSAGTEYVIGWDRVARIDGVLAGEAAAYRDLATLAWRARTRLERGDAVAAEPLYEELFDRLGETDGPTALSICEGLLRCRLWRGAHARALEAWLNWVRIAGEGSSPGGPGVSMEADGRSRIWAMALLPVIDEETGLVNSLPPVWLPGPSVRALVAGGTPLLVEDAPGPGVARARALGALYLHAARFEGGDRRPAPVIDAGVRGDPGVALVADMVMAQAGDPAQRTEARGGLRQRLTQELPAWQESWCRVALGRSLLDEADEALVMEGVVELMHLPARFGEEQPYLTGVALAEASAALARLGDGAGAAALESLLMQSYSGHPALEWADLPRLAPSGGVAPAAAPGPSMPPAGTGAGPQAGEAPPGDGGAPR